jgi:hypothetical protein
MFAFKGEHFFVYHDRRVAVSRLYGTVPFTGGVGPLSPPLELRLETVTLIGVADAMSDTVTSISVTMMFFNSGAFTTFRFINTR